ncbi:hypothetical protein BDR05DRAFT_547919 [Suillus weaverae]|nr:hypothetical protein BDR05DRAFT_547919 [Suillus weaverae]
MDATERQQLVTHSYVVLMANSILMYDHLATLTEEIIFIWRRPKALSAMSFLVNRYFALLGNIYGLFVGFMPIPDQLLKIHGNQTAVHFFSTIHRLWQQTPAYLDYNHLHHSCGKCICGNLWTVCKEFDDLARSWLLRNIYSGGVRHHPCRSASLLKSRCRSARFGLAWLAILGFELLIFVLTVHRTCKTRGLLRLRLVTRRNIVDVMFHDGAMYFGAMTLCNIPNIVMYYYGSGVINGSLGLATLTSCMSVTLISRLMLNLHKSIDSGIFSVPARDDDHCLSVLTTRINVQSAIA